MIHYRQLCINPLLGNSSMSRFVFTFFNMSSACIVVLKKKILLIEFYVFKKYYLKVCCEIIKFCKEGGIYGSTLKTTTNTHINVLRNSSVKMPRKLIKGKFILQIYFVAQKQRWTMRVRPFLPSLCSSSDLLGDRLNRPDLDWLPKGPHKKIFLTLELHSDWKSRSLTRISFRGPFW